MKGPERIETSRLVLRKPVDEDAEAIFARYASDIEVTRYLSWPRHKTLDDTKFFLDFSKNSWALRPAGAYLIFENDVLVGSTGLAFETASRAVTGYVLARDAWGRGIATEALRAMVKLAGELCVTELVAQCHPEHKASVHVLEKCGFAREEKLVRGVVFPNLDGPQPKGVLEFVLNPCSVPR